MNEIENDGSRSPTNAPQRAGFLEFRILIRILGFIKAVAETKLPTFDQTASADPPRSRFFAVSLCVDSSDWRKGGRQAPPIREASAWLRDNAERLFLGGLAISDRMLES